MVGRGTSLAPGRPSLSWPVQHTHSPDRSGIDRRRRPDATKPASRPAS